jgi:hypothetical protein
MVTAIAVYSSGEAHIRRCDTDDPLEARRMFIQEWIDGKIEWHFFELFGPECTVDNPAFTPDFLREAYLDSEYVYEIQRGADIWEWYCCTGIHGSDEHIVTGYFVPHERQDA